MKLPLAPLLLSLLATVSATPQSEGASSSGVSGLSRTCIRVINQRVAGCTEPEFATGRCSARCAEALETMQESIQEACEGARGGPAFLGAALQGRLVETTCNRGIEDDEEMPTTTADRERNVPETPAPSPSPSSSSASSSSPTAQPTGRPEQREERPNGVGGSPFDIVAEGTGSRPGVSWAAAVGFGVLLLVR